MTFPLDWLVERGAILANQIGGEPVSDSYGGANQLWIKNAPARLFVRDVVNIRFARVDSVEPPEFESDGMHFQNRPNIAIEKIDGRACTWDCNRACMVGEGILFEGYAYDYDRRIIATEFSLDFGEHWTRYETPRATADRWVWWSFWYIPQIEGTYELWVRSINETGDVSPEPAVFSFQAG
jgi:hypothetical protein